MGLKPAGLRGSLRQISTEAGAIPDSDLYYKIDEGSGDTLTDNNGSNDGTSTGSLVWVSDSNVAHGYYVELDDTNYVSLSNPQIIGTSTDFSIGIELQVDTGFSSDAMFWNWADGSDGIGVGFRNGSIGSQVFKGGNTVASPSHSEPTAPYNIDLLFTYDASAESAELYLDESPSTGTQTPFTTTQSGFNIGANMAGDAGMDGRGVARFAVWEDTIIQPSEFTL